MFREIKTLAIAVVFAASPAAFAESEKDCLLTGTVQHGDSADKSATSVKIHSVSRYDENSRCRVRRDQKMEFKLPADNRVKGAPDGSEVQYRYRTDEAGGSNTELISVGT